MDAQKSKNKDENEIKKSHHAQLLPPGGEEEGREGEEEEEGNVSSFTLYTYFIKVDIF